MSVYINIFGDILSYTTLRLQTSTKDKLDKLKNFKEESYEKIIERLITNSKDDDYLAESELKQIEKSLKDIKKGKTLSLDEAEKVWGI